MEVRLREKLTLNRSLVGGSQHLELAGWTAARLDWYKTQGCFAKIIRHHTLLFAPLDGLAAVLARLAQQH